MKIFLKILKWIGLSLGSFIIIVILAGLCLRLFTPAPTPTGRLVDIGGYKLHINSQGDQSNKPTLVVEGGAGLPTHFYHWLSEGLKDSMRVVRYDRAGLGYSDECNTPRDPETIAQELHTLLEKAGESPPYIMAGHSLGGPYIRVFTQLYPEEVAGLFFLDATHHDHVERYNAPIQSSFKFKAYLKIIGAQAVLADMGIMSLIDKLVGTPYYGEGLPDETNSLIKGILINGKSFRTFKGEMKHYYSTLERSAEANDFGSLPIRSFTAKKVSPNRTLGPKKKYLEFEDLSSNGRHMELDGNHVTIFSKKENAAIICKEVLLLLTELGY